MGSQPESGLDFGLFHPLLDLYIESLGGITPYLCWHLGYGLFFFFSSSAVCKYMHYCFLIVMRNDSTQQSTLYNFIFDISYYILLISTSTSITGI